ncbi:nicotinate-nucleotide adenylyltransferase [Thorsellia anophelis]|uniref:Probable nicotinate-nucleotide adenylyltransferase n=1 Tax=Thorsellia anophelis DSM 18579 TaxID=1123402 RepID=A0A1I0BPJ5_9GAMM|nr:nicotinate-nucleotide adenylyltransferase [Thorsellia anophelis]SET08798.1 nicotinate-nucleotide adenylyltransferase [Thorsellia anophelis DSM 18579]
MNTSNQKPVTYYGGTFDPIHNGHISICKAVANQLNLETITLLPNNIPPHRPQPIASPIQRLTMLKLAIENESIFEIDTRELKKKSHSYTIETLIELREEIGKDTPLLFIIGEDSLNTIDSWHKWESLLDYCHIIVCKREDNKYRIDNKILNEWINQNKTASTTNITHYSNGYIYKANTPYFQISATEIRRLRMQMQEIDFLLPDSVKKYIIENAIYI